MSHRFMTKSLQSDLLYLKVGFARYSNRELKSGSTTDTSIDYPVVTLLSGLDRG